ncbi:MAG: hypothetical protein KF774_06975 [Planctomyces sp.]|nr:hypothetical protein [Planctomyces sp.]
MDNIDFAVLSRIQELGERFGLKPYDFVATLDHSPEARGMGVTFAIHAETGEPQRQRAKQMLEAIGVGNDGILQGGEQAVIDALDHALSIAPKSRSRV